jgi:hypothetical protein
MTEDLSPVVRAIDAVSAVDDPVQLTALARAVEQFFASPAASRHLEVWFRLFERFPEDDGYELFWSILHGIERQPNYGPLVIASVRRRPSSFPVLMLNRMLNAGQVGIGEQDLLRLLQAADEQCPPGVRRDAQEFLEHQKRRASAQR